MRAAELASQLIFPALDLQVFRAVAASANRRRIRSRLGAHRKQRRARPLRLNLGGRFEFALRGHVLRLDVFATSMWRGSKLALCTTRLLVRASIRDARKGTRCARDPSRNHAHATRQTERSSKFEACLSLQLNSMPIDSRITTSARTVTASTFVARHNHERCAAFAGKIHATAYNSGCVYSVVAMGRGCARCKNQRERCNVHTGSRRSWS